MVNYVICDAYTRCKYTGKCYHRQPHIKDDLCEPKTCTKMEGYINCGPVRTKDRIIDDDVNEWFNDIEL
jgi:hypothetical protein